ncbi:MAG: enoyl-CoA hydratase/isomerase family protein [Planctomycetota bacterium]
MIRIEPEADGIVEIVLDRPDKRNALLPEMLTELVRAADRLTGSARCVVVRGEGRVFCAGFDLHACHEAEDSSVMRDLLTGLANATAAWRAAAVPVVAAVHGAAIAGGCALLGIADTVIAAPGTRFGYPVLAIGVSPAVSAPFLASAVGHGPARERLLNIDLIDAAEAERRGLIHRIVDDPAAAARETARLLASRPRHGLAATKAWLGEIDGVGDARPASLAASLGLVGGPEETALLAAWARASRDRARPS